ncbi:MAG TPA: hypothetical protein VNO17_10030 [Actinomycetota bacterium]|nr:hypothetical protein [Actinomycetota bacterium]
MLAHAGGWDELIMAAAAVLAMVGWQGLRRRPGTDPAGRRDRGPCAYCGRTLQPGDRRCPGCGFRARIQEAG